MNKLYLNRNSIRIWKKSNAWPIFQQFRFKSAEDIVADLKSKNSFKRLYYEPVEVSVCGTVSRVIHLPETSGLVLNVRTEEPDKPYQEHTIFYEKRFFTPILESHEWEEGQRALFVGKIRHFLSQAADGRKFTKRSQIFPAKIELVVNDESIRRDLNIVHMFGRIEKKESFKNFRFITLATLNNLVERAKKNFRSLHSIVVTDQHLVKVVDELNVKDLVQIRGSLDYQTKFVQGVKNRQTRVLAQNIMLFERGLTS